MPSITSWNRLEARPRSTDLTTALAARIRDPLWMLARQWQFGEFRGEDAAAPAFAQVTATQGRLLGWHAGGEPDGQHLQPLRGAVAPDKRDLAKLVVMDFMLVHGNDWVL